MAVPLVAVPLVGVSISSVQVLATNLLRINFNALVKNNGDLTDRTNYEVNPEGAGVSVTTLKVLAGTETSVDYILLEVDPFSIGEDYTVTVVNVVSTAGVGVDELSAPSSFYGRVTKLDSARGSLPGLYSRSTKSLIAIILMAITSEDENIGGSDRNG